jgi:hypothetical protein
LRSILEFVGEGKEGSIIEGAADAADAQRRLRLDINALKRPLVCLQIPNMNGNTNGSRLLIGMQDR